MTVSRETIEELVRSQEAIIRMSDGVFSELLKRLKALPPSEGAALIREAAPALANRVAQLGATSAAQWYQRLREGEGLGGFTARGYSAANSAATRTTVERALATAEPEDWETILRTIADDVRRRVGNSARYTIAQNIERDPRQPGWARIPRPGKCCAWCSMLASQGFRYHTHAAADSPSHDGCFCQIVPSWSDAEVEGYDPDRLYDMYTKARNKVLERTPSGSPSKNDVLAEMRRLHPSAYSDGVYSTEGLPNV